MLKSTKPSSKLAPRWRPWFKQEGRADTTASRQSDPHFKHPSSRLMLKNGGRNVVGTWKTPQKNDF